VNFLESIDDSHPMTTSRKHIAELCDLALEASTILELGSHAGISTAAMALANPAAVIVSVDLCDTVPESERVGFWRSLGIENIAPIKADAGAFLKVCCKFDLVFHDAAHGDRVIGEYRDCVRAGKTVAIHDFEQLSPCFREEIVGLFQAHSVSKDDRGRELFIGKN
jgi:predicted O-methyltransferase YrrM